MKRRFFICLCLLGIGVLALLLVSTWSEHRYTYKGKSLKAWCLQSYSADQKQQNDAKEALKAIGPKAVPELAGLLQVKDSAFRKKTWMIPLQVPKWLRPSASRIFKMPDSEIVRTAAARSLGMMGPDAKAAVSDLAKAMTEPNPQVSWEAAKALVAIGKDSVSELMNALEDKNPLVRQKAVFALGAIGPDAEAALPALIGRLKDEDETVRSSVGNDIMKIGTPALPALIDVMEHDKGKPREFAAVLVLRFHNSLRQALPALAKMTQAEDPAARLQAIRVLGEMRAAETVAITALSAALKDPALEVRLAAAKALGQVSWHAQAAVPALIEALKDESAQVRQSVALTLAKIGEPARPAVQELTKLANDKEESVRAAAKQALAKLEPAEAGKPAVTPK